MADERAQKGRFAAARRACHQQTAAVLLQVGGYFGRQLAQNGARHAQIEGCHGGKTARPPTARNAHAAPAADGKKALPEFFLIRKGRIPAKVLETGL